MDRLQYLQLSWQRVAKSTVNTIPNRIYNVILNGVKWGRGRPAAGAIHSQVIHEESNRKCYITIV